MPGAAPPSLLDVSALHKRYAVPVLAGVHLSLRAGEVHALVGANGAGKSTLARVICGQTLPDAGTMRLEGRAYAPGDKLTAEGHGVHIVPQEPNLIGSLSVAENLFLTRMPRRLGFVRYRPLEREARRALSRVGLGDVDPRSPVEALGVGQQQLVEIAAALARRCRVLILDEPTAALTDPQVDLLFGHIARLTGEGVGVIYISHRMEELRRVAHRVTVLRDGQVVTTEPAEGLSLEAVVRLMVGRQLTQAEGPTQRPPGRVALRVEGLCRGRLVRDVGFEARRGELLGIAGLVGSGRTELLRAVFGADRAQAGRVLVGDDPRPRRFRSPRQAVGAGLAMIPEDRKRHGLLLPQSIRVNATLGRLSEVTAPPGWIRAEEERQATRRHADAVEVRRHSLEQPAEELSGGNQQKLVVARWLMRDAEVFLFDEPTRGIDVAAKATMYRLLNDLASRGKAIVVVSSDLVELMAVCDRIAVMSAGRMVATFDRGEWSQERIMAAALSGYLDRGASEGEGTWGQSPGSTRA